MKKLPILIAFLFILSSSCKKDSSDENSYHLTFKLDGIAKVHNVTAIATKSTESGMTALTIGGFETTAATTPSFGIILLTVPGGSEIKAGLYKGESADYEILSSYSPNADLDPAYHAGTTVVDEARRYGGTIVNHLRLEITAMDSKSIRGTFTGDHHLDSDPFQPKKSVTEGDFYLPLVVIP